MFSAKLFASVFRRPLGFVAGILLVGSAAYAQAPKMAGTWEMDPAKSQVSDGRTVVLVIESVNNKIKLSATTRDKAGQEIHSEFTCAPDGKECEFTEGGHKSKMSMWFAGEALNLAKTDGPPGDVVNEWKLQTSQGSVLTLVVTHIDPQGADETLVFAKKGS